jgi:hypothetical protein
MQCQQNSQTWAMASPEPVFGEYTQQQILDMAEPVIPFNMLDFTPTGQWYPCLSHILDLLGNDWAFSDHSVLYDRSWSLHTGDLFQDWMDNEGLGCSMCGSVGQQPRLCEDARAKLENLMARYVDRNYNRSLMHASPFELMEVRYSSYEDTGSYSCLQYVIGIMTRGHEIPAFSITLSDRTDDMATLRFDFSHHEVSYTKVDCLRDCGGSCCHDEVYGDVPTYLGLQDLSLDVPHYGFNLGLPRCANFVNRMNFNAFGQWIGETELKRQIYSISKAIRALVTVAVLKWLHFDCFDVAEVIINDIMRFIAYCTLLPGHGYFVARRRDDETDFVCRSLRPNRYEGKIQGCTYILPPYLYFCDAFGPGLVRKRAGLSSGPGDIYITSMVDASYYTLAPKTIADGWLQ